MAVKQTRVLLFKSGFHIEIWGLAVHAAYYSHSVHEFITPYEKMYNKIPDLKNICIFDARAYILNETLLRGEKFKSHSNKFYVVIRTLVGVLACNDVYYTREFS